MLRGTAWLEQGGWAGGCQIYLGGRVGLGRWVGGA